MSLLCPKCQAKLAIERPAAERLIERLGAERPIERPGAERPIERPGAERPIEAGRLEEEMTLVCSECRSPLKIKWSVEILKERGFERPGAERPIERPGAERLFDPRKILIAIDGEGTRDVIKEILMEAHFQVLEVSSGREVFPQLKRVRPAVALIDVGLADVVGAQLCDQIKNDPELRETIVILVASIYDKSAKYRRAPTSLFGAEDYIERHNIQKELLLKIQKYLMGKRKGAAPDPAPPERPGAERLGEEKRAAKERSGPARPETSGSGDSIDWASLSGPSSRAAGAAPIGSPPTVAKIPPRSKEQEDAKRLARIIVSDIVLYNKKKVDEGIRKNTFFEILKEEIEEGRNHYNSRVSSEVQKSGDFFLEALEDFIRKKKGTA